MLVDPEEPEQLDRPFGQPTLRLAEGRRRQKRADQRPTEIPVQADLDVVDGRQVAEQANVLERPAHPETCHPVRGRTGDVRALKSDRSA